MPRVTKRELQYREAKRQKELFETFMSDGAERFGPLWLRANLSATDAVRGVGADLTTPLIKAVMAVTIQRALMSAQLYYEGVPATPDTGKEK